MHDSGAADREVFFLVQVGRGTGVGELLAARERGRVPLLVGALRYGFILRTVEGPFFRRVVAWREEGRPRRAGQLYARLRSGLRRRARPGLGGVEGADEGHADGRGIVAVSSTGDVHPAGSRGALGNCASSRSSSPTASTL